MTFASFETVYLGDKFVDPSAARVPLNAAGYLRGEGVFATLRGYDGDCFRAERHLAILARGAAMFGMAMPFSPREIEAIANEAAARTSSPEAHVRITLSRGAENDASIFSIVARAIETPSEPVYAEGIDAIFSAARRTPLACSVDGTIKTTSYALPVLAKREATARGAFEGIMLATDGHVACGTMANLFMISGSELTTPPLATGCRAGVTREAVLELAASVGLTAREGFFEPAHLFDADEVFFTNSRIECLAVRSIEGRALGASNAGSNANAPRHPHTAALRARLKELVTRERATRDAAKRLTP